MLKESIWSQHPP